ncbi:MAG: TonB family protein [Cyanobacteria bacterium P01_D01_bin.156]
MGFSKECFEQYRQEIRIMWRVLAIGSLIAAGFHLYSVPLVARFASRILGPLGATPEFESTPIEVVVIEEEVSQPPPEEKPEEELLSDEPAAAAETPSAPPQPTAADPIPAEVRSADVVQTDAAISTSESAVDGQGAVGNSTAIGLVSGSGDPIESDVPQINLPVEPSPARQQIPETSLALRRNPFRSVTCDPCSLPEYPLTERREQLEGQPVINVIYDESGRVIKAEIEVSSGNTAFDQAALDEALNWRLRDSQRSGGQVSVDVAFVMQGSAQYTEAQQAGEIRSIDLPLRQSNGPRPSQEATVSRNEGASGTSLHRVPGAVVNSSVSEGSSSELPTSSVGAPPQVPLASEPFVESPPAQQITDEPPAEAVEGSPVLSSSEPTSSPEVSVSPLTQSSVVRTPVPEIVKPAGELEADNE